MTESYFPIFTHTSADTAERWKLIRNFIESWHQLSLPDLAQTSQIMNIQQELGIVLPLSFQHYIDISSHLSGTKYTFRNGQVSNAFSKVFRDCFKIEFLKEHDAVSLMIQGEADFYWAVKKEDLHLSDPNVYGYILDFDCPMNDKYDLVGEVYPTITSFVINHLFSYLQNENSSGFGLQINNTEEICQNLKSSFTSYAKFDQTEIFESENLIAFIQANVYEPDSDCRTFGFHIWDRSKKYTVPTIILEMAKNRGWSYGDFPEN
jgi:hypothetical protein